MESLFFVRVYSGKTRSDIALVDSNLFSSLSLLPGDVIIAIGSIPIPFYVQENKESRGGIVINESRLKALGIKEGEKIPIKKSTPVSLKEVTLAPVTQKNFDSRRLNLELRGKMIARGISLDTKIGEFIVVSLSPQTEAGYVTSETVITVAPEAVKLTKTNIPYITLDQVGGLSDQIKTLMDIVEMSLVKPEITRALGLRPPKGVLLYGPPGTGKTLIAKALANSIMANFFYISGPEIGSRYYGESEKRLRDIIEQAEKNSPSIVFIDEIDAIAPNRDVTSSEADRRVVAQLLTLMDGVSSGSGILIIGATNRQNAIDPALRRPGRFDREIEIPVPDRTGRYDILKIHTKRVPLDSSVDLDAIADLTMGFVGADLEALVREAVMRAYHRCNGSLECMKITQDDFIESLKVVEPSALREFRVEIPSITWEDVVGLDEVKLELKEAVEWPLTKRDLYEQMSAEIPTGVLMYGPPGTGKTMLARAVARESKSNFIAVNGPELMSMWVGETERAIREIFKRARQAAPTIVFFDEIDAITVARGADPNRTTDRVVSQLLTEMDGVSKRKERVVVIAATNRPDIIDPALLRPGRLEKLIYVPPPDFSGRIALFSRFLNKTLHEKVDIQQLARLTENYTPAEIKGVVNKAILLAIRRSVQTDSKPLLTMEDLMEALKSIRPIVTSTMVDYYVRFNERARRGMNYA
ncbi:MULTISPECIES: AAA family ATPase [Acidianus]|uniref:ATPase AAA n=1 Tax=Candidatus Acidianus copahuensis TaxID=1160895 RepID=A0A031LS68_9CREN|nr:MULTISPECIES: AAA family ATPase [Acidianus]EZQ10570.1 ATPase AAA [Candidatus Acidianus copahuensis]NON63595.1 AAA family ATPase [Acidianus sp. RZ1]